MPPPPTGLPAKLLVAAVAVGAVGVAVNAVQHGTPEVRVADGDDVRLSGLDAAVVTEPVLARSLPVPELFGIRRAPSGEAELAALSRGAERAEYAAMPRVGVPYEAGDDDSVDGWIAKSLGLMGLPQAFAPGIKNIIMEESGGDPDAINTWDSNARRGTPSEGLMQTIPATFDACVLPSLADRDMTDPIANITAGVRSMIANHGWETLLDGGRRNSSGDYIGYGGARCPSGDLSELDDELAHLWLDRRS